MTTFRNLVCASAVLLLWADTVSPGSQGQAATFVKGRFLEAVCGSCTDVQVRDVPSTRQETTRRLAGKTQVNLFAKASTVEGRDVFVKRVSPRENAHLGIVLVRYQEPGAAIRVQKALNQQGKHLLKTEVLTEYVSLVSGSTLLFVYSETVGHDAVRRFMKSIPDVVRTSKVLPQ